METKHPSTIDTSVGIARYLGSLARFHALIAARQIAGKGLTDFLVLGRWWLDPCGNVQCVTGGPSPKDLAPGLPDVIRWADFNAAACIFGIPKDHVWSCTAAHLPKPDTKCSGCGDGWTIADAHDTITRFDYERDVRLFYHRRCRRATLRAAEEAHFRQLFKDAGIEVKSLEAIPNQYHPCDECPPWFTAQTAIGVFTIGWRKRVIEISWDAVGRDLSRLFKDEDVTKGTRMIHAWGTAKAVNYLKRIRKALSFDQGATAVSAS